MAEETLPGAEGAAPDPLAMGAALGRASPAVDAELIAYLRDQRHHLHEQRLPGVMEKWLGVFLRLATAAVGLAFAGAIAVMVWDAAHAGGLVIEPFSVPPDMAAKGLTGEVVAARMLDRIADMQAQTPSTMAPRAFAGNWEARNIKVEIPETGVSLTELENFLRARLGHETHLSGEIVRTPAGLSLSARVSGGATNVNGTETDFDGALQKLAEEVYRLGQPHNYAMWLLGHGRHAEARVIEEKMIRSVVPQERAIGFNGRASVIRNTVGFDAAMADFQRSADLDPHYWSTRSNLENGEFYLGHAEAALRDRKMAQALLDTPDHGYARAEFAPAFRQLGLIGIDEKLGAYSDAVHKHEAIADLAIPGVPTASTVGGLMNELSWAHDMAAARQMAARMADPDNAYYLTSRVILAFQMQDWRGVMSAQPRVLALMQAQPVIRLPVRTVLAPLTAEAQARLGDFDGAQATLATMPPGCYSCMRAYGAVAELRGQRERADWWFGQAVAAAPSIPFANFEWGRVLLARGQADAAIVQFAESHRRGPHFADPLEGWGQALMAKNQSHLALAKFAKADKYAPNWGRLHLKWGEALVYAGKRDDAKAQFARAAQLDLTRSEKAELARHP